EMYLAATLLDHGFQLVRAGDFGPEFYFWHENKKVWIEAVAPGPGEGGDRVRREPVGHGYATPTEAILLRYTNTLAEKRRRRRALSVKVIYIHSRSTVGGFRTLHLETHFPISSRLSCHLGP